MRISLTNRLTFLFAHASAAMLLGQGLLISHLVESHFEEQDEDNLAGKIELVQRLVATVRTPAELDNLEVPLNAALVGHPGLAVAIRWPDATSVAVSVGGEFPRADLVRTPAVGTAVPMHLKSDDGRPYLRMAAPAALGMAGAPPAIVQVGLDTKHHDRFISGFDTALWFIVVLAAIMNGLLGRMAVRRGLVPLGLIKQEALAITANRLDQRLDLESIPVELDELVQSLNTMLARLEESFQRLSDFSSDLAHELRTPVSNLLMQTQVTLSKPRTAEQYREVLYSNAEEFTRLSRMISDMLFLAKADHGLVAPFKDVVDLADEVLDLFSYFEPLAEGRPVALELQGGGRVSGDRMLIRRAISNVLSNAIRHATPGGRVRVSIACGPAASDLVIGIENSGAPIAAQHIPRLFDRFYRADASRTGSGEGVGLGLAITKSIMVLHGGTITVRTGESGPLFELRLPAFRSLGEEQRRA